MRSFVRSTSLLLAIAACVASAPLIAIQAQAVASIGMTVSDLDRSLEFYTKTLPFEEVSEVEVAGTAYEHLAGVFSTAKSSVVSAVRKHAGAAPPADDVTR